MVKGEVGKKDTYMAAKMPTLSKGGQQICSRISVPINVLHT